MGAADAMIIKNKPDEFRVIERSIVSHDRDDCIVASVEKTDWDTTLLVKALSKALGISHKSIGYAGLKDKCSVSVQTMSFHGIDEERLRAVDIPGVAIDVIGKGDRINIGDLEGNGFEIVARDIGQGTKGAEATIRENLGRFERWHGFLNYFGYQRFGLRRPITGDVGKLIVRKDYEGAALAYIGRAYDRDPHSDIRKEFMDTKDFKWAYENYPHGLRYERAMLFSLAYEGSSFRDCFKALPERLLKLFVHAYQSSLFNEIVKRRIEVIEPNVPEVGDYIVSDRFGKRAFILVNRSNISKVEGMIASDVSIAAPLIGSRTRLSSSTMGRIAKDVMDEEGISFRDFENREQRHFDSSGTQREILARYSGLTYRLSRDEVFGTTRCDASFFLKKGQYATEFLRQLMGEEAIPRGFDEE